MTVVLTLGCLTVMGASAQAAPDPQFGGGAYAVSAAEGVWATDTGVGFAGIAAYGEQGVDGTPVQAGYVDAFTVRCVDNMIVARELWNNADLGFTIDPTLASAAISGTAPADGHELRAPNCDDPSDDDVVETDLSDVPLTANVQVTATGNPTTYTALAQDEDPVNGCAEGIAGGGADRTATGSATVSDVTIAPKDAWYADLSDIAVGGGAVGLTDGCWTDAGQSTARQRLIEALRRSHPRWASLLAHHASTTSR